MRSVLQRLRVPLGFVTAAVFLIFAHPSRLSLIIGFPLALCGVAIRAWASGHLKKNAELAISGPYAYTRNPLYFGSFILALGCAVGGGNRWSGLLLLGFFLAVYIPVMQAEAEYMMTLFAGAYPAYARHVPLFLPRLTPWQPDSPGRQQSAAFDRNLYLRYREYRALVGLLVVFAILGLKAAF
ncbi:MAG TPA: isoprenylcysteine carboxylmethyltransferase family protein [Blastocatellia bacterium]|nr:isoprenylcysteine carboxylmethyltransferase family protein [Blastocatellia bacterium]